MPWSRCRPTSAFNLAMHSAQRRWCFCSARRGHRGHCWVGCKTEMLMKRPLSRRLIGAETWTWIWDQEQWRAARGVMRSTPLHLPSAVKWLSCSTDGQYKPLWRVARQQGHPCFTFRLLEMVRRLDVFMSSWEGGGAGHYCNSLSNNGFHMISYSMAPNAKK